jgi:hypothetical protein
VVVELLALADIILGKTKTRRSGWTGFRSAIPAQDLLFPCQAGTKLPREIKTGKS